MARRDGTGPMGQGAMSGRGMGYCAGEVTRRPAYARSSGFGRGSNFGRGMRRRDFSCRQGFGGYFVEEAVNTMSEKEWLSEERSILEDRLSLIKKELDNLGDE